MEWLWLVFNKCSLLLTAHLSMNLKSNQFRMNFILTQLLCIKLFCAIDNCFVSQTQEKNRLQIHISSTDSAMQSKCSVWTIYKFSLTIYCDSDAIFYANDRTRRALQIFISTLLEFINIRSMHHRYAAPFYERSYFPPFYIGFLLRLVGLRARGRGKKERLKNLNGWTPGAHKSRTIPQ